MITLMLPFSMDALQGAVRRYLSRPAVDIEEIIPERLGGAFGGAVYRLKVAYRGGPTSGGLGREPVSNTLNLVLKGGTHGSGTVISEARREAAFYRTLAPKLPVRTPRMLLTADDILGEPTIPLVISSQGILTNAYRSLREQGFASLHHAPTEEWILMEALPSDVVWPRASWTANHYRLALTALADMHAAWWGSPPKLSEYPWVWTLTGQQTASLVREASAALLEIERAPWGDRFFPKERLRAWLSVLEDPTCLLDALAEMPQTLIHGDYWPGNIAMRADGPAVFDWQLVGVGPAPYDLACFHSLSRWWFGRVPLSLADMRNHYLSHLNERLGESIDRYAFDLGVDAARAWRFAVVWPTAILEHHTALLGMLHQLQNAVIEPAFASLRRCA